MNCSSCGAPLVEGARFCMKCGLPVEQKLLCSNCGAELPVEAMFCYVCGTKVGEKASDEKEQAKKTSAPKKRSQIEITGITLLSVDEYMAAREIIGPIKKRWWLRSPGVLKFKEGEFCEMVSDVAFVDDEIGVVDEGGENVSESFGVRPALIISNMGSSDLRIGDKIEIAGCRWTIIPNDMALCDRFIAKGPFRVDDGADDASVYEVSDVKKYIENWWSEADADGLKIIKRDKEIHDKKILNKEKMEQLSSIQNNKKETVAPSKPSGKPVWDHSSGGGACDCAVGECDCDGSIWH